VPGGSARASYLAYRAGAAVAQGLPPEVGARVARLLGRAGAVTLRNRRAMAARHQQRAAGHTLDAEALDRAVEQVFESYARYWLEMFRLAADVGSHEIERHFEVEGFEHIETGLAAGRGVIVALPHLGGWEWAGPWMAARGHRLGAVVEPVEPPELFDWFARARASLGMEVIPLGPDVVGRVLRALRENRVVCLLSDRDLSGDGVPVEFFGEETTLPAGPATLALRTGAALVPLAVYFEGTRDHRGVIRPALAVERRGRLRDDIARVTQDLAHELEALIRVAPEQWHLLQPNWPSDRDAAA